MLNIVQVERGKSVEINSERDDLLTEFIEPHSKIDILCQMKLLKIYLLE